MAGSLYFLGNASPGIRALPSVKPQRKKSVESSYMHDYMCSSIDGYYETGADKI